MSTRIVEILFLFVGAVLLGQATAHPALVTSGILSIGWAFMPDRKA